MRKLMTNVCVIFTMALFSLLVGFRGQLVAEEEGEIKVGMSVPLSGPVAYWGICMLQPLELGAEDINARGGVKIGDKRYNFKVIAYDSKGTVADSRAATIRLVDHDKVKCVFSQAAASTIGVLEVTEPKKLLSITACWGYRDLIGGDNFYHFRAEMSDYEFGYAWVPWMKKYYPGIKTAVFLGPDDKDGYDCFDAYKMHMQQYNIKHLGHEYFSWETTDFYPVVTKMLRLKPDCIITNPTPPGMTAAIVKAAREMGYKGPIASPAALEAKTILQVCGEFADDVILPMTIEPPQTTLQKEIRDKFVQRYGEFNALAGIYSFWMDMLAEAYETAGTFEDSRAVCNALEKLVVKNTFVGDVTFTGKNKYGLDRQAVYQCYTGLIEDGEVRVVDIRYPDLPPGY